MDNKEFNVEDYLKFLEEQSVQDRIKRVNNTVKVLQDVANNKMSGQEKEKFLSNLPTVSDDANGVATKENATPVEEIEEENVMDIDLQ